MSMDAVRTWAASVWHSRWLTIVFVVGFSAFVCRGLWLGRQELRDPDCKLEVQFHLVRSTKTQVVVRGIATRATVRESGMRAMLVGPSEVSVQYRDTPVAMLELAFEWEECGPGDSLQIVDEASGVTHVLANLDCQQTWFSVPLPYPDTRLRLVPSRASLGYSLAHYKLVLDQPLMPFTVKSQWSDLHKDDVASIQLGAGWWPYQTTTAVDAAKGVPNSEWPSPASERWSRNYGCLRIDPVQPGPHRVGLVLRKPDPQAPLPRLYVGGVCVLDAAQPSAGTKAVITGDLIELELTLDLGAGTVLGIECPGRFRSLQEFGKWADWHRVAYEVKFDRCRLVRVP